MRAALGLPLADAQDGIPVGIYTIPEIASVGLSEAEATQKGKLCFVGRAHFRELARGQIAGCTDGMLKLVTDAESGKVLGCQIVGEGATELIHLAQLAMANGTTAEAFVESIFNFPTLAEAYRVAGLDVMAQRQRAQAVR